MDTLHTTIEELKTQRREMVEQVQLLDDAIRSLERINQRGHRDRNTTPPLAARSPQRRGPGTTQAVLTVLSEANRALEDTEILRAMEIRGWAPPSKTPLNALRATLSRLKKSGKIERRERDGAYRLPRDTEASREQEASDLVPNQGGSSWTRPD
jgi:hypothetical protein